VAGEIVHDDPGLRRGRLMSPGRSSGTRTWAT
jgi:hypothetical protein